MCLYGIHGSALLITNKNNFKHGKVHFMLKQPQTITFEKFKIPAMH